jgi:hypothetical protein
MYTMISEGTASQPAPGGLNIGGLPSSGFKEADVRTGSQKRSQRSKGRDQSKKHHRRDS